MPSHQDRREPLPADYQFGDSRPKEDAKERERKIALVKGLMDSAIKAMEVDYERAMDEAEKDFLEGR